MSKKNLVFLQHTKSTLKYLRCGNKQYTALSNLCPRTAPHKGGLHWLPVCRQGKSN